MHAQLFHQFALAADAIEIANQQDAQQKFGINRGSAGVAVAVPQSLAHKVQVDVLVNQAQQVIFQEPDLRAGRCKTAIPCGNGVPS
jgi:hypothetical protein